MTTEKMHKRTAHKMDRQDYLSARERSGKFHKTQRGGKDRFEALHTEPHLGE
jgi:hypothetical protein